MRDLTESGFHDTSVNDVDAGGRASRNVLALAAHGRVAVSMRRMRVHLDFVVETEAQYLLELPQMPVGVGHARF